VLRAIQAGLLSDPPGIPLYFQIVLPQLYDGFFDDAISW
jgi:hypothetical protein